MVDLVARLACSGPLRLLDGGNRLQVYTLNLAIARALETGELGHAVPASRGQAPRDSGSRRGRNAGRTQEPGTQKPRSKAGGPAGRRLRVILERIQLARAFTCYQLLALLRDTPEERVPTLVLDLLATFYDESVPAAESQRLLRSCVQHLTRLNRVAPVAISVRRPDGIPVNRPELLEFLVAAAGQVWMLEPEGHTPQPRLF
jgi:hypothetical protein